MSGLPPPPPSGSWGNVGPYATSAAPRPPMRSLRGLATALTVLFALIAIVEIAAAAALFTRAGIFDDAANGVFAGFDEASSADDRVTAFVGLHLVGVFAIAITFITWQFRHAKNAQVLGSYGGLGPGWAIGGWFIPLANYVLPAVQLHQSSRSSDVAARRQGRRGKGSGLVILWAILWALSSLTFVGGGGLAPTDSEGNFQIETVDDLEQSADSDRGEGVGMVFYALAALAAIAMVRSLSKRQTDAFAASGDAAAWAAAGGTAPRPTAAEEATTYAASSPDWAAQSPQRDYAPPPPPGAPPAPSPPPPPAPQAPPPADSGPPPPPAPE